MKRLYHASAVSSTPLCLYPGNPHPPLLSRSYGDFGDRKNEKSQIPPDSYETKTPLYRSGRKKAP